MRLFLVYRCKERITQTPPVPTLKREKLEESCARMSSQRIQENGIAQSMQEGYALKHSGKIVRSINCSEPLEMRVFKAPVCQPDQLANVNPSFSTKSLAIAEVNRHWHFVVLVWSNSPWQMFFFPDVVHSQATTSFGLPISVWFQDKEVGAMGVGFYGWHHQVLELFFPNNYCRRNASFLIHMFYYRFSLRLFSAEKKSVALSKIEKEELVRRQVGLLLYIVRSPFYDNYSKMRIIALLRFLSNRVPFARLVADPLEKYLPQWQNTYFYTWSCWSVNQFSLIIIRALVIGCICHKNDYYSL